MFQPNKEQVQQTPQYAQSPDDIEDGEEFIHKLTKVEDFGDLSEEAVNSLMGMYSQVYHHNFVLPPS